MLSTTSVVGDLVGPLRPSYDISDGPVDRECIYRRNGGCGAVADAKLYVWGGEGAEQRPVPLASDDSDSDDDFEVGGIWAVTVLPPPRITDHPFDVYDMQTCTWSRQKTSGDVPISVGLGSSLNYHPETRTLYLFGGFNYGNFDANIYRVQLDEWCWQKVEIRSKIKPMGRYLTGTLIHESRLCTIGGSGLDIALQTSDDQQPQDAGARYEQTFFKGSGYGLNNEYYEFDMESDEWSAPLGKYDVRPDPLACPCFVKFDAHRAILFGGRYKDGRRNDIWIFNLEDKKFSEIVNSCDSFPTGREQATLTPLIDPMVVGQRLGGCGPVLQQRMLLLWGKQVPETILTHGWILDIAQEDISWTKFDVNTYARAWHIAGPLYYTNSTECRLAIFGGNVHWDGFVGKRRNIGDIRIVTFGVPSLSRLCASVIAREGKALSAYNLPSHSQAYKQIHIAIETLNNATPTLTVSRHLCQSHLQT